MLRLDEISPTEIEVYTTRLVPILQQVPLYQWLRIDTIAKDVAHFIDVCQLLANHGYFQDENGFLIIEIKMDSFVRLDPEYHRKNANQFRIWK